MRALIVVALAALAVSALPAQTRPPERLNDKVAQLLKEDEDNPPSSEAVLFAGGDTVANWDTRRSFGRYRTVRRGLPGGTLADCTYFADKLIAPLKPSSIVIESGDTGLSLGMSADQLIAEFRAFTAKVHQLLPKTRFVALAVRPDPSKPETTAVAKAVNDEIAAIASSDRFVLYVDNEQTSGPDGKPDPGLLEDGKMRLNKLGYQLLSQGALKELVRSESRYWNGTDPMGK